MKTKSLKQSVQEVKSRIVDTSLIVTSILGSVAYLLSLLRFSEKDFKTSTWIELLVIGSILLITLFRKHILIRVKTMALIIILILFILNDILTYGILSAARIYIILVPFVVLVYYRVNRAILLFITIFIIFLVVGYLHSVGYLTIPYDPGQYAHRFYPWIINIVHISVVASVVMIIIHLFNNSYSQLITELEESNRIISQREQSYREIFNASSDGILILDLEGRIMDANNSVEQLFGYPKEEILHHNLVEMGQASSPIGKNEFSGHLNRAIREQIHSFDWMAADKNGRDFWVDIALKKADILGSERILAVVRDIDEKKHTALELISYRNHLELLVKERTEKLDEAVQKLQTTNRELESTNQELNNRREQLELTLQQLRETQEQLIQTEKMASLGILTAGVAHEINNPLNYIQNGTKAIQTYVHENFPEHLGILDELFSAVNTGINRTTDIVKSLNRYSRQAETEFHNFHLHHLLENCLTILFNQYKNRIRIIKQYDETMPEVNGSEGKIHQAFLNILSNAIQAIPQEGEISIKTTVVSGKAEIRIRDTGTGISPENLKYIFDPFFTTKDPGQGTGLGLSITRRIIQEHKGTIRCQSRLLEGTEFIVSLPLS